MAMSDTFVLAEPHQVALDHKFVVALRAKLDHGVATNAASHLGLSLVAKAGSERPELLPLMSFLNFPDAESEAHAPISGLSLAVLEGRAAWLRRLRSQARAAGLLYTDFSAEMTQGSYVDQLERMARTAEADLDYYGVAVFGPRDALAPMTKKFSLLR